MVSDPQKRGPQFLMAHLERECPMRDWIWTAREVAPFQYLVEPPPPLDNRPYHPWREYVLARGVIRVGGVTFPAEPWDPLKHDCAVRPFTCWVKIRGLSLRLWKPAELGKIVEEIGGHILDVDQATAKHLNL